LSRNTYLQLHNIEKNGIKNTLTEISTQPDEKTSLGLNGIRFTSRNQQDSCVYRFELSRGKADFVDFDPKTRSTRYLRTYFNGYGYYNVKTSKFKFYLRPFNAYTMLFHESLEYGRIPLTGRYLIYELKKVQ